MRAHELYVADCIDCHKPVESRALPVPQRCTRCQTTLDESLKPPVLNPFNTDMMETIGVAEFGRMTRENLRQLTRPLLIVDGNNMSHCAVLMSYGMYMKIQKAIIDVHKSL